jgi:hypothetical protein
MDEQSGNRRVAEIPTFPFQKQIRSLIGCELDDYTVEDVLNCTKEFIK